MKSNKKPFVEYTRGLDERQAAAAARKSAHLSVWSTGHPLSDRGGAVQTRDLGEAKGKNCSLCNRIRVIKKVNELAQQLMFKLTPYFL